MRRPLILGLGILAVAAVSAAGAYALTSNYYRGVLEGIHFIRDTNTQYQFIAPLLSVVLPKETGGGRFAPLVSKINAVAAAEPSGTLIRYSVYFRDLATGNWTGINENAQYNPASMLKVAAAIATYKQGEDHPGYLDSRPVHTRQLADINAQFPYAPSVVLTVGSSYSIPFLVQEMLSDSDNAAKDLLLSSINAAALNDIYTDLLIPLPSDTDSSNYTISSLDYSRFFRVLYN